MCDRDERTQSALRSFARPRLRPVGGRGATLKTIDHANGDNLHTARRAPHEDPEKEHHPPGSERGRLSRERLRQAIRLVRERTERNEREEPSGQRIAVVAGSARDGRVQARGA